MVLFRHISVVKGLFYAIMISEPFFCPENHDFGAVRNTGEFTMDQTNYKLLIEQACELTKDCPYLIANLANVSALLYQTLPDINWAGFYLAENDKLILGPFQGNPACIEIPFGKGVCGTAAEKDETQLVSDVHQFPGHIACDSASRSEIVIPLHKDGAVFGVLDIDSPSLSRFSDTDKEGLEKLAKILEGTFQ